MTVTAYRCRIHGEIPECAVDEGGERVCPDCWHYVEPILLEEDEP